MEYSNLEGNTRFFPDFSQHGYAVERKLGNNLSGGRVTYQAIDLNTKQTVAIKQFQFAVDGNSWSDYEALECEIAFLQKLNHPSIPKYIGSFETESGFCLVQEYKNALSLAQPRCFELEQIREIGILILKILVYLQHRVPAIIHRDIKPENILVDDNLYVYLVDFGFAKIDGQNSTSSSIVKGTLGFMPPEQMFGRPLSTASDLYGLGMTLICLLTGTPSSQVGKLIDDNHRVNVRSLLPNLNPHLINWLEKMVAPAPQNRYSNADEALVALLSSKTNNLSKTHNAYKPTVLKPVSLFLLPIGLSIISTLSHGFISQCKLQLPEGDNINIDRSRIDRPRIVRPRIDRPGIIRRFNRNNRCWTCKLFRTADLQEGDLEEAGFQEITSREASLRIIDFEPAELPEENNLNGTIIPDGSMNRK